MLLFSLLPSFFLFWCLMTTASAFFGLRFCVCEHILWLMTWKVQQQCFSLHTSLCALWSALSLLSFATEMVFDVYCTLQSQELRCLSALPSRPTCYTLNKLFFLCFPSPSYVDSSSSQPCSEGIDFSFPSPIILPYKLYGKPCPPFRMMIVSSCLWV